MLVEVVWQSFQVFRQLFKIILERAQLLLEILACAADSGDGPAAVVGLVVEVVEQILQIAERGLDVVQQLLVLRNILAGLFKGGEDAARGGTSLWSLVLTHL